MITNAIIGIGIFLWAVSIYFDMSTIVSALLFVGTLLIFSLSIGQKVQKILRSTKGVGYE